MNKAINKLQIDLEAYLENTDLLSVESLTDAVLKTLYLISTYKALFERESESE